MRSAAEDWDAVETLANRAARTWGAKAKEINIVIPISK